MECRRALILAHFGEAAGPGLCAGTCDLCASGASVGAARRDVTQAAQATVRTVRAMDRERTASTTHVVDVLRGALNRAVRDRGHDGLPDHGSLKDWAKHDVCRLVRALVARGALTEETQRADNDYGAITAALRARGAGADAVLSGAARVELAFAAGAGGGGRARGRAPAALAALALVPAPADGDVVVVAEDAADEAGLSQASGEGVVGWLAGGGVG